MEQPIFFGKRAEVEKGGGEGGEEEGKVVSSPLHPLKNETAISKIYEGFSNQLKTVR